jgi:hypothetical protein
MMIYVKESVWPMAHEPADEESRELLVRTTGWAWIPWPYLSVFREILRRHHRIQLLTI